MKRLSRVEDAKVVLWIDAHARQLMTDRPQRQEVLARMQRDLSIPDLTIDNVQDRLRAAGVKYMGKRTVIHKRATIRTLTTAVVHLYRELGVAIPADLTDLQAAVTRGDSLVRAAVATPPASNGQH